MISRTTLAAGVLALATAMTAPATASATVIVGTYAGVIKAGLATGGFGFAQTTNLTGQEIHGTFSYDTDGFVQGCPMTSFFACYTGGGLTITQTVNGVTETFVSSLPPVPEPMNHALGGISFYTLGGDEVYLGATGFLGSPRTLSRNYWTSVGALLPTGSIAAVTDRYATYSGPAHAGGVDAFSSYGLLDPNRTRILELTAGDLTMDVDFTYDIRSFSIGPAAAAVPEPATWAILILGMGLAGATLRRQRRLAFVTLR